MICSRKTGRPHGDNAPKPVRTLRDWLDHLAARDRMAVLPPALGLKFEVAAYAKRLDGQRATVFPKPSGDTPGGHAIPVVSGLVSDRGWMAEAMGVEPSDMLARFQEAAENPLPWRRGEVEARRRRWSIEVAIWTSRRSCRCRPTTNTTAAPISRPA